MRLTVDVYRNYLLFFPLYLSNSGSKSLPSTVFFPLSFVVETSHVLPLRADGGGSTQRGPFPES